MQYINWPPLLVKYNSSKSHVPKLHMTTCEWITIQNTEFDRVFNIIRTCIHQLISILQNGKAQIVILNRNAERQCENTMQFLQTVFLPFRFR